MASEPVLTRASLLAFRASLEQRFDQSMKDIDAALRLLDIMEGSSSPTAAAAPRLPATPPQAQPKTNLGPRFEEALAKMPHRFTKKELVAQVEAALGREVSPGTVPFCIERLLMSGKILLAVRGGPGRAAVYEQVSAEEVNVDDEQDEAA